MNSSEHKALTPLRPCYCKKYSCDGLLLTLRQLNRHYRESNLPASGDMDFSPDNDSDDDMPDDISLPSPPVSESSETSQSDDFISDSGVSDIEDVESSDETDEDYKDDNPEMLQYALWFVEHKYTTKATNAQVDHALRICRRLVALTTDDGRILDDIPNDFQQAITRTKHLILDMIQRDGCIKDHYLFEEDSLLTECPVCGEARFKRNGLARRSAYYVKPDLWVSQLLSVARIARQFSYMRDYIEDCKFRGEYDDDHQEIRDFSMVTFMKRWRYPSLLKKMSTHIKLYCSVYVMMMSRSHAGRTRVSVLFF